MAVWRWGGVEGCDESGGGGEGGGGGGGKGERRLNFSAKLPHLPPTKIGTCPTLTSEIKSLRPNFEKRALTSHVNSSYVSAYINFNV